MGIWLRVWCLRFWDLAWDLELGVLGIGLGFEFKVLGFGLRFGT